MDCFLSVKNFVMQSGERYCVLVDSFGLPVFYPNLFVTTQIRNKSLSVSAMEAALSAIAVLYRFMDGKEENLENRFKEHAYLEMNEIESIRDFCQKSFRTRKGNLRVLKFKQEKISKETEYSRLTSIAAYVEWLANTLGGTNKDKSTILQIQKMMHEIKARRPKKRGLSQNQTIKALDETQIQVLFEIFRPQSDLNPFDDPSVKIRNRIIFLMLYHLGIRGGELLNVRIRDLDFSTNQILIARRADEKGDFRTDQPLVKTLDRRLPLKDTLAQEIHNYIVKTRKFIPNANKHDFLLVTHKSGPTQGQPISIIAYKKIMETIRMAAPDLHEFTGHRLRHTWNDNFSRRMDGMDQAPNEERQEQIRSYLMGWRTGSGTAAIYNQRFIKSKAYEASLSLQKGMVRSLNKELENDDKSKQ